MVSHTDLLIDILHYVRSLQKKGVVNRKLGGKDVLASPVKIESLPGIHLDTKDGAWLRIERQIETQPPTVDPEIERWVRFPEEPGKRPFLTLKPAPLENPEGSERKRRVDSEGLLENDEPGANHEVAHLGAGKADLRDDQDNKGREQSEEDTRPENAWETLNNYIKGPWARWWTKEERARKTNALYHVFREAFKDLKSDGGAETKEVALGVGRMKWRSPDGIVLDYPAIIHSCEVTMNAIDPVIEVRPAGTTFGLETTHLQDIGLDVDLLNSYIQTIEEPLGLISPFDSETYASILEVAASKLSSSGKYIPDMDLSATAVSERLTIYDYWSFFLRERPADRILKDLAALEDALRTAEIPPALVNLVDRDSDRKIPGGEVEFRGVETIPQEGGESVNTGTPKDLYFPLPYNDEQVRIIQRLEKNNGVVVQGPPGTGKSHTIANIICHYLANGKRVLVTSSHAGPLEVLRGKIPSSLRPLTAALLSSDRKSIKEFEKSINGIASKISGFDWEHSKRKITRIEAKIDTLHNAITDLDGDIEEVFENHLESRLVESTELSPIEIGAILNEGADKHDWLAEDRLTETSSAVSESVDMAREARRNLGSRVAPNSDEGQGMESSKTPPPEEPLPLELREKPEFGEAIPAVAIPDPRGLSQVWRASARLQEIEQERLSGRPWPICSETESDELMEVLETTCRQREDWGKKKQALGERHQAWDFDLVLQSISTLPVDDSALVRMVKLCRAILKHYREGRETDGRVVLDSAVPEDADACKAIAQLAQGESGFGLTDRWFKKRSKALVDSIALDGRPPESSAEWGVVVARIKHQKGIQSLLRHWNTMGEMFGLPQVVPLPNLANTLTVLREHSDGFLGLYEDFFSLEPKERNLKKTLFDDAQADLEQGRESVALKAEEESLRPLLDDFSLMLDTLGDMGPTGNQWAKNVRDTMEGGTSEDEALEVLDEILDERDKKHLMQELTLQEWEQECERRKVEHDEATRLWEAWVEEDRQDRSFINHWRGILEEGCASISAAGAINWAERLLTEPCPEGDDPIIPDTWAIAWRFQYARQAFDHLGNHQSVQKLMRARRDLVKELVDYYQWLIARKTWRWIAENSSPQILQALQKYLGAVRLIGKGTGKRAARHQKTAQDAMREAYQAIPCWIMPYQRVSESMPATIGLFDLVIVDEASQSDIQVIPALLRGKKILVVGDDKQVSPSAVGQEEKVILEQAEKYLSRQPFGHSMGPDRSIYDLFSEVFAGSDIMLREHFRSARPIIEFSNREFYDGKIIPLRLPSGEKALTPALVNIFVEDGTYRKNGNEAEAAVICEEIRTIVNDPAMAKKSIGVVTLHSGTKQSTLIRRMLNDYIDDRAYLRHDISIGPPPSFQGKERDIVLVSMTWDGGRNGGPNSSSLFEQRFNVALSRARDRMILVRSVPNGHAKPGGLLEKVLNHFRRPFGEEPQGGDPLERCETQFEKRLAGELIDRGFRVSAHEGVRGFRMDLVVEGEAGRRLAIGCDGDRKDDEESWVVEMSRQRVLERAGWKFWRCFAAHFEANPKAVLKDLLKALSAQGIRPMGEKEPEPWVEHWIAQGNVEPEEGGAAGTDEEDEDGEDGTVWFEDDAGKWPTDRAWLLSQCDPKSPPERDVMSALLDMGYRVQPQYRVRGYFVDFLVQGPDGRRLAIEYDGDSKYNNPDYINRERERQVFLEKTEKLPFHRIFHSDFTADRDREVGKMRKALEISGVMPFPG